jgi:hypothetical protein
MSLNFRINQLNFLIYDIFIINYLCFNIFNILFIFLFCSLLILNWTLWICGLNFHFRIYLNFRGCFMMRWFIRVFFTWGLRVLLWIIFLYLSYLIRVNVYWLIVRIKIIHFDFFLITFIKGTCFNLGYFKNLFVSFCWTNYTLIACWVNFYHLAIYHGRNYRWFI